MLISCGKPDIEATEVKWDCANNICSVTFSIQNNTHNHIQTNYAVRAHRRTSQGSIGGAGATSNLVVGEIKGSVLVNSGSVLNITEQIKTKRKASNINVSIWEK